MTQQEVMAIASKFDDETKLKIDQKAEELLEILKEGELDEEEMQKMEDCLYTSLIIQEYLDGEYELLDDEKQELLDEMEEIYNQYGDLLIKTKIEEKVSKRKRMALHLMKIREELMNRKTSFKDVSNKMKQNREDSKTLQEQTSPNAMKDLAKKSKLERKDNLLETAVKVGAAAITAKTVEKIVNKVNNTAELVSPNSSIVQNPRPSKNKDNPQNKNVSLEKSTSNMGEVQGQEAREATNEMINGLQPDVFKR